MSHDYHSIPWLNWNLASVEKCSGPLTFRLRQVLLNHKFPVAETAPVRRWELPTRLGPTEVHIRNRWASDSAPVDGAWKRSTLVLEYRTKDKHRKKPVTRSVIMIYQTRKTGL
jgi:hypothetical protein